MVNTIDVKQMDLVPLWKALAHPKRRRIIHLLGIKPHTTNEISAHFDVSRFAIMRHLKVLEQAGLIDTRREGRQRWNFLNEDLFHQIQQTYLENYGDDEYKLGEILNFLALEEGARAIEKTVVEQQPIKLEVILQAGSDEVFQALTRDIDAWWSCRIMADSQVFIETEVGGRFFELFRDGGGALYGLITCLKPGKEIRLSGSMGFTEEAVNNLVQITIQAQEADTTLLQFTHHFPGWVNLSTYDAFKRSWEEQLTHQLKPFVEQGIRFQAPMSLASNRLPDAV